MAKLSEVVQVIEEIAPRALALETDNPGLLVDCGKAVDAALITLDITAASVEEAKELGCGLIVAHHPVIYRPIRRLGPLDVPALLVQAGISALCAHSNLDAAQGGVNDVLAETLGLTDVQPFGDFGRIARTKAPQSPRDFALHCGQTLGTAVRFAEGKGEVRRVAMVGGTGGNFIQDAYEAGADCLLTGDAGHHDALTARRLGISLVAAGHFPTEWPVVPALAKMLAARLPAMRFHVTKTALDPFAYLV